MQTVLLDQGKCSFPVNHPKTMGVKVVGTVKSHHTKKKNVVFDPNKTNTEPTLNCFFQQRCLENKQRNKTADSEVISRAESVNLVFNTKRPV